WSAARVPRTTAPRRPKRPPSWPALLDAQSSSLGAPFQPSDHLGLGHRTRETPQLLNARWAGDVHLNQVAANQIETHKVQTVLDQFGRQRVDQLLFSRGEGRGFYASSHVNVGANIVCARDAQNCAEHLPFEQEHALVAFYDA